MVAIVRPRCLIKITATLNLEGVDYEIYEGDKKKPGLFIRKDHEASEWGRLWVEYSDDDRNANAVGMELIDGRKFLIRRRKKDHAPYEYEFVNHIGEIVSVTQYGEFHPTRFGLLKRNDYDLEPSLIAALSLFSAYFITLIITRSGVVVAV